MGAGKRCGVPNPSNPEKTCVAILREGSGVVHKMHRDYSDNTWEIASQQPDRAAQVEEIQARTALGQQLSGVGFTREELTAATAAQQSELSAAVQAGVVKALGARPAQVRQHSRLADLLDYCNTNSVSSLLSISPKGEAKKEAYADIAARLEVLPIGPTKAEILAAIDAADEGFYADSIVGKDNARAAVEKLFEERGL
jgi:hypothetical protein